MGKTKIKSREPIVRPVAAVPPVAAPAAQLTLTKVQKERLRELTSPGAKIDNPYARSIVNDLRQTIADHARAVQYLQQLEQSAAGARDRITKLEGQIDGFATAITRWEDHHGRQQQPDPGQPSESQPPSQPGG